MYQLKTIGKMQSQNNYTQILIYEQYKKALKFLDTFSHIHIFYTYLKDSQWQLYTSVVEIESVDLKNGKVLIKAWYAGEKEVDIVDIKPYFPCEDSVKEVYTVDKISRKGLPIQTGERDEHYKLEAIGCIRCTLGKVYLDLNEWIEIKSNYIKVLWWFDRFDGEKYRRAVECNPPYENAPRTGIFATRSPVRPNPIAMTVARVVKQDKNKKRIYISGIESFDKTPCIGIIEYDKAKDLIIEAKVPKWLEHWPKWLDDRQKDYSNQQVIWRKSGLITLIEAYKQQDLEDEKSMQLEEETPITESCKQQVVKQLDDGIWIKGAKENNLKGINIKIPYHKITAVVGVSGSGKSSLVKDTIYAECKRRMAYLNNDQNKLQKPNVEYISGCIPAVMISQKEIKGNAQSTVGTYTNAYDSLRMIYATVGVRHCPECGNEIVPLSKEFIVKLLSKMTKVKIYDLNKQIIAEGTLKQKVEKALEKGQGALYTTIDEGEYILMQTKQKCYHCDKLMFELTPTTFSYMDPESRCPICNGTGKIVEIDEKRLIEHPELSLLDGAASFWGKLKSFKLAPNANWMKGQVFGLAEQMQVDLEKPWCALPEAFKEKLLHGTKEEVTFSYHNKKNGRKGEISRPVEGMIELIKRLHDENEESNRLQKYMKEISCTYCEGERLNKEGRMVTVGDLRYPEVGAMSFDELLKFCIQLPTLLGENQYKKVETFVIQLKELAQAAEYLGIGYLEMNRETSTLSGGEGQRLKLLSAMQNHMKGLLYLFDEPSKGLHPKDYHKVAQMMRTLKEEGNTIIMVEHNEDMIRMADYIIEIGLEAGEAGGYLVGEGTMDEMLEHTNTQLSHYLGKNKGNQVNSSRNHAVEFIKMQDLNHNNLKNIAIQFPKKALTCICGVSGSGKSSLMKGAIYERCKEDHTFSDVCLVDQLPIGRTSRSVVATYIGVMDAIRAEMALTPGAVERAYDEKMFSFNGEMGQCQECKGEGRIKLKYIEDADILCPDCKGRRYKKEVLEITYQDKNIADILQMSVKEAIEFWRDKEHIAYALQVVDEVGMGYLRMGQSTTTLSGGEASRLKLAKQLMGRAHKNVLYLLDEPTTGLHFSDVEHILKLINKLIQEGNTVIAIEHNKQFISKCDWFIELGPGAGREGGRVIYQGNK